MSAPELESRSYMAATHLEEQNGSAGKDLGMAGDKILSKSSHSIPAHGQMLRNMPVEADVEVSLKRWNESKTMVSRVLTSFWCMVVLGSNDGQIGAIIPYVSFITSLICVEHAD